jgi:hypothetical protein
LFGNASSRANGFSPSDILNAIYGNLGTVFARASKVGGKPVSSSFVWGWVISGAEGAEIQVLHPGYGAIGPHVFLNISDWNDLGEHIGVDLAAMTALLLHEMGHVYEDLAPQGSGGTQIANDSRSAHNNHLEISMDNDQLVFKKCYPELYP